MGPKGGKSFPERGGYAEHPSWSPHGDRILYEQKIGEQRQLFVVDLGSHITKQLTRGSYNVNADWFDPAALPCHTSTPPANNNMGEIETEVAGL